MRIATRDQSRQIDELSQTEFSLSSETLMEAAGTLAAREISQSFVPELRGRGGILVVCGPGNNGGDGLVVARQLQSMGVRAVRVLLAAPQAKRSPLFLLQLERCQKQGVVILDLNQTALEQTIQGSRLIVDALFGIGLKSELRSPYIEIVQAMNRAKRPVVSLDAPSGLDVDKGTVSGAAVKATITITFGLAKPGFFVSDGPEHVGRLKIFPIGFPRELFKKCANTHFAVSEKLTRSAIPSRARQGNKTQFGRVLILAGSPGMMGAALLSATSAFRMGAGYVLLASNGNTNEVLSQFPEILTADAKDESFWKAAKFTAAGVGPGLGTGAATETLLKKLIAIENLPVVADADAITVIAQRKLYPLPKSWVITPHAGELSRLINQPAKEIENNRFDCAKEAAKLLGCHVLLKGFRTVITDGERLGVVLAGNSALAKAGTGDVLTGMIAALLAQKVPTMRAAGAAAYVHGRIADEWVRAGNDRRSMEASDLREILPGLLSRITHV